MNQARLHEIATGLVMGSASLQTLLATPNEKRKEATAILCEMSRLSRSLLPDKPDPAETVADNLSMLTELRWLLESVDPAVGIKGLSEKSLRQLLTDMDTTREAVIGFLFNLLRNQEGDDGLEKPAA